MKLVVRTGAWVKLKAVTIRANHLVEVDVLLELLRSHDGELAELHCGDGGVLVSPGLQGRVFCHLGGELVHRLDGGLLESPSTTEFNNLGGNSLWPAPEGGAFAFNYLPDSDLWLVQPGIAEVPAEIVSCESDRIAVEKRIELINRKGVRLDVVYRRSVSVPAAEWAAEGFKLSGLTYRTEDTFEPIGSYSSEEVLIAPWSLEQFPGSEGVTIFCKVREPENAINFDFYVLPGERIVCGEGFFTFALGGEDRHQIGIKMACAPECIGALDANRSMLMLRRAEPQEGIYFNIADNEQALGPYSAADLYSVFNGGALGFFELETIGAMQVSEGRVAPSTLVSETTILKGEMHELRRYLAEREGVSL